MLTCRRLDGQTDENMQQGNSSTKTFLADRTMPTLNMVPPTPTDNNSPAVSLSSPIPTDYNRPIAHDISALNLPSPIPGVQHTLSLNSSVHEEHSGDDKIWTVEMENGFRANWEELMSTNEAVHNYE